MTISPHRSFAGKEVNTEVAAASNDQAPAATMSPAPVGETPTPTTENNPIMAYFLNLASIVVLTSLITGWFVSKSADMPAFRKQIISWVVCIGVCVAGHFLKWGFLADYSVGFTVGAGVGIGLVTNHVFDIGTLDALLGALGAGKKA